MTLSVDINDVSLHKASNVPSGGMLKDRTSVYINHRYIFEGIQTTRQGTKQKVTIHIQILSNRIRLFSTKKNKLSIVCVVYNQSPPRTVHRHNLATAGSLGALWDGNGCDDAPMDVLLGIATKRGSVW